MLNKSHTWSFTHRQWYKEAEVGGGVEKLGEVTNHATPRARVPPLPWWFIWPSLEPLIQPLFSKLERRIAFSWSLSHRTRAAELPPAAIVLSFLHWRPLPHWFVLPKEAHPGILSACSSENRSSCRNSYFQSICYLPIRILRPSE